MGDQRLWMTLPRLQVFDPSTHPDSSRCVEATPEQVAEWLRTHHPGHALRAAAHVWERNGGGIDSTGQPTPTALFAGIEDDDLWTDDKLLAAAEAIELHERTHRATAKDDNG